jgi:hypothetical protein
MPFLEAYARADNFARVKEIAPFLTANKNIARQVCQTLKATPLSPAMRIQMDKIFCPT